MKNFILLIAVIGLGASCNKPSVDAAHSREIFDASGLKVIASFANRRQHIMATLYGNDAAKQAALAGNKTHIPGEVFTMITWQQANNKYWYGSYINGAITSVETIKILPASNGNSQITYKLIKGKVPGNSTAHVAYQQDRINLIFAQRPSVFP